jgi:hypothetical protein
VKFALAEVSVLEEAVVTPSTTDRARVLSMVKFVPAGIAAVVGALKVTSPAPLIDRTNVRGTRPGTAPTVVIGRFTHPAVPAKDATVNVVAPEAIAPVVDTVRADPLWNFATLKS